MGEHFIISILLHNIHPCSNGSTVCTVMYRLYLFCINIFTLRVVITEMLFEMRFLCTLTSVIQQKLLNYKVRMKAG